jgi:hypothetical protein
MNLEKIWYELFPYAFAFAGVIAILYRPGSLLLRGSGLLLLAVSAAIVAMRWLYRRQQL